MTQYKSGDKGELILLHDLLAKAIDSTRALSIEDAVECDRLLYAYNLANKFINHVATLLYLLEGTIVRKSPSFPEHKFIDSASIEVLSRSAMEAFLVFHFVFYAPNTQEERNFRYLVYKATGITERQSYPVELIEHQKILDGEKAVLKKICEKLEENGIYKALTEKQRKRFIEGKELDLWRWTPEMKKCLSWYDIGLDAGFSEVLAIYMYRHLSGYAHSGSLSVIQTAQALINGETEKLTNASIDMMKILISYMINEYCQMFTGALKVLEGTGARELINLFVRVGKLLGKGSITGKE